MDLRSILNRPAADNRTANTGSNVPASLSRPAPVAQSSVLHHPQAPQPHASPSHQSQPHLLRQQSFPAFPAPQHAPQEIYAAHQQVPHSSHAPGRDDYFRDHTMSVSPKTQPHSISRHPSYDVHAAVYDQNAPDGRMTDVASTTPNRIHNRQPSLQSYPSDHSAGLRDTAQLRELQTHSPHIRQTHSVTSSPMQSRSTENHTPNFTNSPHEARPPNSFRPPTQSPLQPTKQSPVIVKAMAPPFTPSQTLQSPLAQNQDLQSNQAFMSPAMVRPSGRTSSTTSLSHASSENAPTKSEHTPIKAEHMPIRMEQTTLDGGRTMQAISNSTQAPSHDADMRRRNPTPTSSRKRSIGSNEGSAPPAKRPRYPEPPIWARRVQWKTPLKTMEEWIPHPRNSAAPASEPLQKLQRVPSVAQPAQQALADHRNGQASSDAPRTNGTHQNQSQGARDFDVSPVANYELSLDGHVPFSDITREVARFLFANVVTAPELGIGNFEVEAKLGHLIDPRTDQRLHLPISTEAVLQEGHEYRFQSYMTIAQHKRMNDYLNTETRRTQQPNAQRAKIQYEHLRETDRFFEMPREFFESLPDPVKNIQNNHRHAPRIRVTTDQKTGQIKAAIYKLKVRDLEIYCPADDFDVRISVALEIRYPHTIDGLVEQVAKKGDSGARYKDRLSYKHQFVSVDLTQVTDGGQKKQELELEIETDLLRDEGLRAEANQPNNYEGICGIFTNYIRVMNRTCRA